MKRMVVEPSCRPVWNLEDLCDPATLKRFGITRVGDITDLDILGVPVWFAVRPNSRGLSISQGKGLTPDQARISAIMEAIEGAVAEDTQRHTCAFGSMTRMLDLGEPLIPIATIGRTQPDHLDPDRERAWVKGVSIRRDDDVLAPFELIGMDFRDDMPWDRGTFHMSSEGLAAGFDYDCVVLHALFELIENDACFLLDAFETRNASPQPVALKHGVNPSLDTLVKHLRDQGLVPEFRDLTTHLGIPVVLASLERPVLSIHGPVMRRSAGVACRMTAYDAALAALLEAVQSRLTDITGARDDLSPHRFLEESAACGPRSLLDKTELEPRTLELHVDDRRPMWRLLVDHLFKAGLEDIYVFPLETGVEGIHVVRALSSGLNAVRGGVQPLTPGILEELMVKRMVR